MLTNLWLGGSGPRATGVAGEFPPEWKLEWQGREQDEDSKRMEEEDRAAAARNAQQWLREQERENKRKAEAEDARRREAFGRRRSGGGGGGGGLAVGHAEDEDDHPEYTGGGDTAHRVSRMLHGIGGRADGDQQRRRQEGSAKSSFGFGLANTGTSLSRVVALRSVAIPIATC